MAPPHTPKRGDPKNIERFLAEMRTLLFMTGDHDLRIGQAIHNVLGKDFFNVEDPDLIAKLRAYNATLFAAHDAQEEGEGG